MKKLLALNRGEIAIRIMRAASELQFRTVAVYSKEDRLSLHRFKADEAYQVGEGLGPVQAYLDAEGIVALAKEKGVDLIHPGYGFLSENPALARACEKAGIAFVGPSAELLELLGDKTAARHLAERAGVPIVPGTPQPVSDPKEAMAEAERIGSTGREIKNAPAHKGAAIIHCHCDAALIGEIGDAQNSAKRQAAMCGC